MSRIVILYNEPTLPADHPDADSEHEIIYTVEQVETWLRSGGHETHRLGVHVNPSRLIDGLRELKPDVVFNLFEGLPAMGQTEAFAVGLLEWLGIPYTGCAFASLVLARDKPLTKRLLRGAGLPTPEFILADSDSSSPWPHAWPAIVKPSNQDASVGITQESVTTSAEQCAARVAWVIEKYGPPALIEQYIPGREINVAVWEGPQLTALPPFEYECGSREGWRILTYEAKWKPGSYDFENTPVVYEPKLEPDLAEQLADLAKRAFRLVGCRDLARVDFRVAPAGELYILEVNPNPDFSPIAGLADCFENADLTHTDVALQMVQNALTRGAQKLAEPLGVEIVPWC